MTDQAIQKIMKSGARKELLEQIHTRRQTITRLLAEASYGDYINFDRNMAEVAELTSEILQLWSAVQPKPKQGETPTNG